MATNAPPEAMAAQYALLQRRFVEGLAARLSEIEAATEPATLHACLHRLAGAAGAFGYAHLGELARHAMRCTAEEATGGAAHEAMGQLKTAIQALLQGADGRVDAV